MSVPSPDEILSAPVDRPIEGDGAHETDVVRACEEIAAPCALVFEMLTDPAELAQWMRTPDGGSTHDWVMDPEPGGRWSARSSGGTDEAELEGRLHGEVVTIEAPHLLELTWREPGMDLVASRVRFTLEPLMVDGEEWTRLTVTHIMRASRGPSPLRRARRWSEALQALAMGIARLTTFAGC